MIKKILDLYNSCTYCYDTDDLGDSSPFRRRHQFDPPCALYKYINKYYPELTDAFDLIKSNEKKNGTNNAQRINKSYY